MLNVFFKHIQQVTIMNIDLITRTPGLIHIAEQIFSNLDRSSLLICQEVNEHWASILRNPWFWYNRIVQNTTLSPEHLKEWMKFCEKLKKLNLTRDITPELNFIYEQLDDSKGWSIYVFANISLANIYKNITSMGIILKKLSTVIFQLRLAKI